MPLTVSNNSAVASASYYLGKNQKALQHSIKKLASGKRIISPNDDPGTLSVVMKLNAAVNRMAGAKNNVQNGISFVEIQDGMLETVGRMVNRMAELKGMATQDPMKSDQDIESYNNEFHDLPVIHPKSKCGLCLTFFNRENSGPNDFGHEGTSVKNKS